MERWQQDASQRQVGEMQAQLIAACGAMAAAKSQAIIAEDAFAEGAGRGRELHAFVEELQVRCRLILIGLTTGVCMGKVESS